MGIWFAVESACQNAAIEQHRTEPEKVVTAREWTVRAIGRLTHRPSHRRS
ncbi:hypothetical protein ACIGXF_38590 [Streptomyces sp. NPDC053086]